MTFDFDLHDWEEIVISLCEKKWGEKVMKTQKGVFECVFSVRRGSGEKNV
jgi:hypothetical protein